MSKGDTCDVNVGMIILALVVPVLIVAALILLWYFFKQEDEYTEEYETFLEFYKYRCCGRCGQYVYDKGPAAVEMVNPYVDPLEQAQ